MNETTPRGSFSFVSKPISINRGAHLLTGLVFATRERNSEAHLDEKLWGDFNDFYAFNSCALTDI
jgi:hypothetical protein